MQFNVLSGFQKFDIATFSIFTCNFLLQSLLSIAQNIEVYFKKILQTYFSLVLFSLIA